MGIGATLAEFENKDLIEFPKETGGDTNTITNSNSKRNTSNSSIANSNPKGKKSRRRQKKMAAVSPVQKLYDTCKEVFSSCGAGIIPSPEKIDLLSSVLDEITPEAVGVTPNMPYFRTPPTLQTPPITYLHLYHCEKFSMGIFCLPPSGVIPLHNHPEMTVFSKLLFGTMHVKSYDFVTEAPGNNSSESSVPDASQREHPEVQLAKVKVDSDFTAPCSTSILFPADGGNLHCFTAVTACAVLDVLGPPYDDPERPCTYYLDFPYANFSVEGLSIPEEEQDGYAWLQARKEKPEDLAVNGGGAMYRGPSIIVN